MCDRVFAQAKPHWQCQSLGYKKGKCRDPRCSMACYRNWAKQQSGIVSHFLTQHQESFTFFRGSMKFHSSIPPREVKNRFLYELRKWKKRRANCKTQLEFRAVQHCTAPDEMHYDFIGYVTRGRYTDQLRNELAQMWRVAGGAAITVVEQEEENITAQACYIHKSLSDARFKRKRIFLPVRNGERMIFQTKRFFQNEKLSDLWEAVKVSWYGENAQKRFWEHPDAQKYGALFRGGYDYDQKQTETLDSDGCNEAESAHEEGTIIPSHMPEMPQVHMAREACHVDSQSTFWSCIGRMAKPPPVHPRVVSLVKGICLAPRLLYDFLLSVRYILS